jgi:hypothetical protein
MKADQVGHLFLKPYLMFLKLKQTILLVLQELNITVRNAEGTMDIYLMMDPNPQAKDIAIMDLV